MESGAIQQCKKENTHCLLPLRVVPKKNKKLGLVVDCRYVNNHIKCDSFTQEGINSVADQIEENDQLITIDLENGFHHVQIKKEHHKCLCIYWKGRFYNWTVLPFGVKCAPYYFNKMSTSPRIVQHTGKKWGPHSIDRFASPMTSQLPRYNSLYLDPETEAVDAMAQSWKNEKNFINPPFWMLGHIIKNLIQEKATATLITPKWPAQPWYQTLKKITNQHPVVLLKIRRTMLHRAGVPEPMKNVKWKVLAWRISGEIN